MNRSWHRGFNAAKAASMNSIAPRTARKVGAALFSGSILLSLGHNDYGSTHTKAKAGHNLHAEHRALLRRQYYDSKNGLIMYVFRQKADGSVGCSRPCNNCMYLMRESGVRLVRFVNLLGEMEEIRI